MPDLQKDLKKCLNDASLISPKENDKADRAQTQFESIRNKYEDKFELLMYLGSQIEDMRSVSAKNIGFFNNLKDQLQVAVSEVSQKISVKAAICGTKPALDGSSMSNLGLQSMAIDLRRLAEGKIKNYQSEFFTNLVRNRYSLAPKLVESEFTDSVGSHRRAEREREARPKAPKSSEKQITESLFDGEEYYTAAKTKMSALHRVKGRVLLSLCKTQAPDSRTAFVRWYVRTHRKFGKYAIQQLAVKNKISSQVALWRFKF